MAPEAVLVAGGRDGGRLRRRQQRWLVTTVGGGQGHVAAPGWGPAICLSIASSFCLMMTPVHPCRRQSRLCTCVPFQLIHWTTGRDVASEYGEHMARVARKLFDALAAALGLDADQTASYLAERDGTLRVYRYPPCPAAFGHHLGMEAHTDSSVLSIINQDLVGGLQVLHEGSWRDVTPAGRAGDTLLVNLGDMAQAISGDAYRSVPHRVAASRAAERLSLCYFAFPRDDAVLSCCGSRYRPFSYAEFREQVQADIKATGSKVGLERFLRH